MAYSLLLEHEALSAVVHLEFLVVRNACDMAKLRVKGYANSWG